MYSNLKVLVFLLHQPTTLVFHPKFIWQAGMIVPIVIFFIKLIFASKSERQVIKIGLVNDFMDTE